MSEIFRAYTPGPQGAAFAVPMGSWSNLTAYSQKALVQRGSKLWLALQANTGVEPGTNGAIWFEFFSFRLEGKPVPGTTYQVVPADDGYALWFAQGCAVTYSPDLAAGFACLGVQIGAGQVTLPAGGNPEGFTKTFGQGSVFSIMKDTGGVRATGSLVP
jgi:hypothetical protein